MSCRDRNFDDIAHHFQKNIYGSPKGRIRLHRLRSDLNAFLPELYGSHNLNVLDAGGGLGQLAIELASSNQVILSDVSAEMLKLAKDSTQLMQSSQLNIKFEQASIQMLAERIGLASQDVVLCHAVLEWVDNPKARLFELIDLIKPAGYLSLATYNRSATFFRNLINGNFKWIDRKLNNADVEDKAWKTKGNSLTPPNPLMPDVVEAWLIDAGCIVVKRTGIRVFDDYRHHMLTQKHTEDDILQKEEFFGVREPFSRLGRYNHFLVKKL